MAEKSRVTTPRGRHESWCQASAVRGCVPILINPEFDAALDRDSCVTHWMSSPGSALWYTDISHLTIFFFFFFFFFLSFRECCLTRAVTEYRVWHKVRGAAEEVRCYPEIPGCRYRRTKPPKPDASQFVVPARLPKPVIGSGGLSSSQFDDDVPDVSTAHEQRRSRGESRKLRFGSNRTAPKIWQEGQHALHSPPQPMIDENTPLEQSTIETILQEAYKYQKVTKISCDIGSRFEASWLDCVTMMSEMTIAVIVVSASCHHLTWADSGWSRISWFSRVTLPWLRGGTSVAPWRHKCSHVPVFRRLFDRLPVRISTSDLHHRILRKKLYHIRAYDFGVQFSFK